MKDERRPRVPLPAVIKLPGAERTIQVNHCKMPACENFGVPARTEPITYGPSGQRDTAYTLRHSGGLPGIRCKACEDRPPIKSNAAIASEVDRLTRDSGIWRLEEITGCGDAECENHVRPIAFHPDGYRKRGKPKSGQGQYYQCKSCGRRSLVSDPVRLRDFNRRHAADMLGRIANKSPVRGSSRGAGLPSMQNYYQIVDFLHRRCRAYSGAVDRAFIDGRLSLPEDLDIQSDAQVYRLNWISRLDRRNVELSAYATVHHDSHFVLAMHCNFDGHVDPFKINAEAARNGDLATQEAYREFAQYWLAGDELRAGRAMGRQDSKARIELLRQIERLYADAASREDVENIELQALNTDYSTPFLSCGLQVHMPYTAYAHWLLLHRLLKGAGVRQVQANMDIDSMGRAAFLSAFVDEVKRGDAHAFFVKSTKYQTIDERRDILADSRRTRNAFRKTLPEAVRGDPREVARRMMKARIGERQKHGKWDDEWVEHPLPTLNEPHKAMSWLTPDISIDEDRKADLFLRSGLGVIDNVFLKTRRLFNALERPVGTTSSGGNTVWHGYAPYNPAMLEKYVTIFRAVNNFVFVGDDGATPAMRLGFAKQPLQFEDIIWPGQRVPRPKKARRRGKRLVVA